MQQDPGFGPKTPCKLGAGLQPGGPEPKREDRAELGAVGLLNVAMGSLAHPGPPGHPGNACDGKPTGCIVQACVALEVIWHWPVAVVQDI